MVPSVIENKNNSNTLPVRRLTPAEMAARREKGLCYNCDEKFTIGHRCKAKFQCYLLEDSEVEVNEVLMGNENDQRRALDQVASDEFISPDQLSISFHAMQGQSVANIMRLEGRIKGCKLIVLIDGGSTHNFLQTRIARHLELIIEPSENVQVTIGDGTTMQCEGICKNVSLQFGDNVFCVDFFLLPSYGADVVLGAHWLAGLGPTLFDYQNLWFSFQFQGKQVTLDGIKEVGSHDGLQPLQWRDSGSVNKPLRILNSRKVMRQGHMIPQVLVQWADQPQESASWEDWEEFMLAFPQFNLEDEVISGDGGIDTSSMSDEHMTVRKSARQRIPSSKYSNDSYVT